MEYDVRDGTHDTPKYCEVGYPLITSKNPSSAQLTFDDVKLVSEDDHRRISKRSLVEPWDVLLAMIGSNGNPVIVDTDRPFSMKNVAWFKYYDRTLSSPGILCLILATRLLRWRSLREGGFSHLCHWRFFGVIPSFSRHFSEQHRIVAKVDELMILCDRLEKAKRNGRP